MSNSIRNNYSYPSSFNMQDTSRPRTPGTPGTFDTRYSSGGGFGSYHDNEAFASQYDPFKRARSPSPMRLNEGGNRSGDGTYYFDKEGGSAAAAGGGAGAIAAGSGGARRGGFVAWIKRHPVWAAVIGFVVVAAIVAAAVGGAIGASNSSKTNALGQTNSDNASGGKSGSGSGSSGSTGNTTATSSIVPLAKWNMTDPETRMVGVSLGNWLVLERWIDEDWFTQTSSDDTWDEWSFVENLGREKALAALTDHWNTYVQESDIDSFKSVGINTVRIPIGYWAFVDAAKGEPYLAKSGQTDQLQKVLGWLYDRGMYAMIDLHGMPGSQNGDQASGHNTSNIAWFDADNFGYSYDVLSATIQWIQQSNYSSVVHSVCPVNEPRPQNDDGKWSQLTQFYEAAYTQLKAAGLIMMFHHGFRDSPFDYWTSFATGKDPNYLAFNTNPYPGYFPANSDSSDIVTKVCEQAQQAVSFPVPVVMTEYSLINAVGSSSFNKQFYSTEVSAWAWSGGGMFWTFKTAHSSSKVLALADNLMDLYSFTGLIDSGIIQKVDAGVKPLEVIKQLSNQKCGTIPTTTWSNPSGKTTSSKRRSTSNRTQRRSA